MHWLHWQWQAWDIVSYSSSISPSHVRHVQQLLSAPTSCLSVAVLQHQGLPYRAHYLPVAPAARAGYLLQLPAGPALLSSEHQSKYLDVLNNCSEELKLAVWSHRSRGRQGSNEFQLPWMTVIGSRPVWTHHWVTRSWPDASTSEKTNNWYVSSTPLQKMYNSLWLFTGAGSL